MRRAIEDPGARRVAALLLGPVTVAVLAWPQQVAHFLGLAPIYFVWGDYDPLLALLCGVVLTALVFAGASRWRWPLSAAIVALTLVSPSVMAHHAWVQHRKGNASIIEFRGMNQPDGYAEIDAITRLPIRVVHRTCMGVGPEQQVERVVNNATVRVLDWLFDSSGAYEGPLPTAAQLSAALGAAGVPAPELGEKRSFTFDGQTVRLPPAFRPFGSDPDGPGPDPRAVVLDGPIAAVERCWTHRDGIACRIDVFDLRRDRPLGVFRVERPSVGFGLS